MKKTILILLTLLAMPGGKCSVAKDGGTGIPTPTVTTATTTATPEGGWAVINTSSVFMRGEASYTSENVSQSRMGTPVQKN